MSWIPSAWCWQWQDFENLSYCYWVTFCHTSTWEISLECQKCWRLRIPLLNRLRQHQTQYFDLLLLHQNSVCSHHMDNAWIEGQFLLCVVQFLDYDFWKQRYEDLFDERTFHSFPKAICLCKSEHSNIHKSVPVFFPMVSEQRKNWLDYSTSVL